MACGFDPAGLKPIGWKPGTPTPVSVATVAPEAAALGVTATLVAEARPQAMEDPDWVQAPVRSRLSYLGMAALLAVILAAIAGVVVVMIIVLHHPVATTSADALGLRAAATVTG
jgi:hypothetical protein